MMLQRKLVLSVLTLFGLIILYSQHKVYLSRRLKKSLMNNNVAIQEDESVVKSLKTPAHIPTKPTMTRYQKLPRRMAKHAAKTGHKTKSAKSYISIPRHYPRVAAKLPEMTRDAQDAYYGPGCKVNRNRRRLQLLLHEWREIVRRRNIAEYFLCFGSLVGSVRNGEIIPYDSDVDVCVFRRDYHKLLPEESKRPVNLKDRRMHMLVQRHSPHPSSKTPRKDCNGTVVRNQVDGCSILDPHARLFLGAHVFLDIFVVKDNGAQLWDEYRDKLHERAVIFPLRSCTFLGLQTLCPNDGEKYLGAYYGTEFMKPHYVCKNGKWVKNRRDARERLL